MALGLGLNLPLTKQASAPFVGLLDAYPGASLAFSLRKLRDAYTGPAIKVRRSSDNTELDIGFTAAGDLDESALTAFVGAGNGFVTTWYDQSLSVKNATQILSTQQPQIVSSGSIITENSKPAMFFDGGNDCFQILSYAPLANAYYMASVFRITGSLTSLKSILDFTSTTNGGAALAYGNTANKLTPFAYFNTPGVLQIVSGSADLNTLTHYLLSVQFISGNSETKINGVSDGILASTWTTPGTQNFTFSTIGYDQSSAGRHPQGRMQELLLYTADETSVRTNLENNIIDFWGI